MSNEMNESTEDLLKEIEELKLKVNSLEERNLINLAEFDNSRKRLEKEFQRRYEIANESIILALLEILDNFDRALDAKGDILKGIEMIKSQFIHLLTKEGVEPLEAVEFNPEFHQVIEVTKGKPEVVEVRKGYKLKNKVIRPTLIKIIEED